MKIKRNYVGEYCTSLEMAGFSLTLVKLDPELEGLLAAPPKSPSAPSKMSEFESFGSVALVFGKKQHTAP